MEYTVIFKVNSGVEDEKYLKSLMPEEREKVCEEHTDDLHEFIKSELSDEAELLDFEVRYSI